MKTFPPLTLTGSHASHCEPWPGLFSSSSCWTSQLKPPCLHLQHPLKNCCRGLEGRAQDLCTPTLCLATHLTPKLDFNFTLTVSFAISLTIWCHSESGIKYSYLFTISNEDKYKFHWRDGCVRFQQPREASLLFFVISSFCFEIFYRSSIKELFDI